MTERELKKQLKNAYCLPESESGRRFVRQHQQRGMHLGQVIRMEAGYIGLRSAVCIPVLCLMLYILAKTESTSMMWFTASVLPVSMLAGITGICKSEKYGMGELEAASRFSLRMIRAVRMLIIGIISVIVLAVASLAIESIFEMGIVKVLCCIGMPLLLNLLGCVIVIRKWHSRENIFGCCGVTLASCLIPFIAQKYNALAMASETVMVVILGIVALVTVVECILYFRESENLSWSLY